MGHLLAIFHPLHLAYDTRLPSFSLSPAPETNQRRKRCSRSVYCRRGLSIAVHASEETNWHPRVVYSFSEANGYYDFRSLWSENATSFLLLEQATYSVRFCRYSTLWILSRNDIKRLAATVLVLHHTSKLPVCWYCSPAGTARSRSAHLPGCR
jgi:hypothetical protein